MFDEKADFFKDRPFGIDSEEASSELAFKILLKRFPTAGHIKELKEICKAQTSQSRVTLSWFSEEFPGFPVKMFYKNVPWVRDMWDGLYSKFKKTDLYSSWKEEEDKFKGVHSDGRPSVLVFNWPKWKTCCMHNCESERFGGSWYSVVSNDKSRESLKIVRSLATGETFVIEPFDQFLESISWSK